MDSTCLFLGTGGGCDDRVCRLNKLSFSALCLCDGWKKCGYKEVFSFVDEINGISEEQKADLLGETAAKLFSIGEQ